MPEHERGEEHYWAIQFAVDDMATAHRQVIAGGGQFHAVTENSAFIRDPDGAALFIDVIDWQ